MGIIGAILGDIAGSSFEFTTKRYNINDDYELFTLGDLFTDDTVLSIATMEAMNTNKDFANCYQKYGKKYIDVGYGPSFMGWLHMEQPKPYNSLGNGSAMRCSYIGQKLKHCPFKKKVLKMARKSAEVTHNHPEGIKGAETVAICVWMAERGKSKEEILQYALKQYPSSKYKYGCDIPTKEYQKTITYDVTCMGSVPVAIRCFYDTDSFDSCQRLINSMNCDADTIGAIAGAICESYYGFCTDNDVNLLERYLDDFLLDKLRKYKII